ncbi:hypothetical protein P691DRAFT_810325, partial [Macrolepiota fuliginosa MF-IS2]
MMAADETKIYDANDASCVEGTDIAFWLGALSLPQGGWDVLGSVCWRGNCENPVEVFEGHTDVVEEFVWRKGGFDEFHLIIWSKDRTLRFWPVEAMYSRSATAFMSLRPNHSLIFSLTQKVSHHPEPSRGRSHLSKTKNQQGI